MSSRPLASPKVTAPPAGIVKGEVITTATGPFVEVGVRGHTANTFLLPWAGFLIPEAGQTVWVHTQADVAMFVQVISGPRALRGTVAVTIPAGQDKSSASVSFGSPSPFTVAPKIYTSWDNTSGTGDYPFLTESYDVPTTSGFTMRLGFSTAGTLGTDMVADVDWLAIGT